jgi:hypothetical protein
MGGQQWGGVNVGAGILIEKADGETFWRGSNSKFDKKNHAIWQGHNNSETASLRYVLDGLKKAVGVAPRFTWKDGIDEPKLLAEPRRELVAQLVFDSAL